MLSISKPVINKAKSLLLFMLFIIGFNNVGFSQPDKYKIHFPVLKCNGKTDSVIVQSTNDEGEWFDSQKHFFTYHPDGSVASEEIHKYNYAAEEMRKAERRIVTDPTDNSIKGQYFYEWRRGPDEWRLDSINEYKYDVDGNLIEATYGSNNYNKLKRRKMQYENGVLMSEKKFYWDDITDELTNKEFMSIIYDDEGRLSEKSISDIQYGWYIKEQYEYTQDSTFVTVEKLIYESEMSQFTYTLVYDEVGRVSEVLGDVSDSFIAGKYIEDTVFTLATKELREYDENNRLVGKKFFKKPIESSEWKLVKQMAISFHNNGQMKDSTITKLNLTSGQMNNLSVYSYDSLGALTESMDACRGVTEYEYGNIEWEALSGYISNDIWIVKDLFHELWYNDSGSYSKDSVINKYANGEKIYYEKYNWNSLNNKWEEDSYWLYVFDGNIATFYSYDWEPEAEEWLLSEKRVEEQKPLSEEIEAFRWNAKTEMWDISYQTYIDTLQSVLNTDSIVVQTESYWNYNDMTIIRDFYNSILYNENGNISAQYSYWKDERGIYPWSKIENRYVYYPLSSPTTDIENAQLGFKIYPTIASKQITVSNQSVNKDAVVYLYNTSGELLGNYKCNSAEVPISVAELPQGIYYIQLSAGSETIGKSFIKK